MTFEPLWLLAGALGGWFLCERKAQHALAAASTLHAVTQASSEKLLSAAEQQAQLGANVKAVADGLNDLERGTLAKLERLAEVIDSLDRNQGAILNGLVNSHIIRFAGPGGDLGEQVGERPLTPSSPDRVDRRRVPPIGEDAPLIET